MLKNKIPETITVRELLTKYPYLVYTFIDLRLMCVGCPTDGFHTLADVARAYGLNLDRFLARLQKAIENALVLEKQPFRSSKRKCWVQSDET